MASSATEVLDKLRGIVQRINPAVDLADGPLTGTVWAPVSILTAATESSVEQVANLLQLTDPTLLSTDALDGIGGQLGISRGFGRLAQVNVTFYSATKLRDTEVLNIPAGTLVGVASSDIDDQQYVYATQTEVNIPGSLFPAFRNATTQRYEFTTLAIAVSAGEAFNVQPRAITKLISRPDGIDGVINYGGMVVDGSDPLDNVSYAELFSARLEGYNRDSGGGVRTLLESMADTLEDVSVIKSTNTADFFRVAQSGARLATDVYLIGTTAADADDTHQTLGGEIDFVLDFQPVMSVTEVLVDSQSVPFTLIKDTSRGTRESSQSTDTVRLETPAPPLSDVLIRYTYNRIVADAQSVLSTTTQKAFGDDVLVRSGVPVGLEIGLDVSMTNATDAEVVTVVNAFIRSYLADPEFMVSSTRKFGGSISPDDFVSTLRARVAGISHVRVRRFRRLDANATQIQNPVSFRAYEYPGFDESVIDV